MGRLQADDFRLDEPIPYVAVPRGKSGRLAAVPLVPENVRRRPRLPRRRGLRPLAPILLHLVRNAPPDVRSRAGLEATYGGVMPLKQQYCP